MNEMILRSDTLPEPLFKLIRADRVRVRETGGIINLIPIKREELDCPLRGIASDSNLTVEKFLTMKHADKELER
jgi:hypothetical protein